MIFSQGIANHTLRADYFTANNSVKSSPLILRVSYVERMLGYCGPLVELSLFCLFMVNSVDGGMLVGCTWLVLSSPISSPSASDEALPLLSPSCSLSPNDEWLYSKSGLGCTASLQHCEVSGNL